MFSFRVIVVADCWTCEVNSTNPNKRVWDHLGEDEESVSFNQSSQLQAKMFITLCSCL